MQPSSKPTPEQWADAKRLRSGGTSYERIAAQIGIAASAICRRARKEGWPTSAPTRPAPQAPRRAKAAHQQERRASPAAALIRGRLALRLYAVIECKIKMMELRMIKELEAHERANAEGAAPPSINDEREIFAALIDSINRVTEIASEPAPAPAGKRRAASGPINPELTALSTDIDPDGLAIASEKDNFRREIAEQLGKMFPKP
jgi:hypothetical protein